MAGLPIVFPVRCESVDSSRALLRVSQADEGAPFQGGSVQLGAPSADALAALTAGGSYMLAIVDAGTHEVLTAAAGSQPTIEGRFIALRRELLAAPGDRELWAATARALELVWLQALQAGGQVQLLDTAPAAGPVANGDATR